MCLINRAGLREAKSDNCGEAIGVFADASSSEVEVSSVVAIDASQHKLSVVAVVETRIVISPDSIKPPREQWVEKCRDIRSAKQQLVDRLLARTDFYLF